jgi:hypothetical protein
MNTVKSRAGRILRGLARYRELPEAGDWLQRWPRSPRLRPGETPLGVYENTPGQMDNCVLVTSSGLHVHSAGEWAYAAYDLIKDVRAVPPVEYPWDKLAVSGLALDLYDGRTLDLQISGGNERSRDAWEVMRFLDRVTQDVQHPRTMVQQG